MSIKRPAIAFAAVALLAVGASASASAQEHCGFMYQRVMQAYQAQSPHYGQMLNHYQARCLSGASGQPGWEGNRSRFEYDRYDRRGYPDERLGRGW